jgi:HPt (histidine-containing phosphotransfer) domain-containing protein
MKTETIDLEELKRLSNGDEKFFHEMLSIFINTTRQEMSAMSEGLAKKDWKRVSDGAHKIVPPCRHVGAMKLHDLLKNIERKARDEKETEKIEGLINEAKEEAEKVIAELEKVLAEQKKTT